MATGSITKVSGRGVPLRGHDIDTDRIMPARFLVAVSFDGLEKHLFEADVLRDLPRAIGASPSTLLRTFRRELGESPLAYVRTRRLDEALMLLKSRRLRVSEVSALVGYRNFAAFSHALRERFGLRPSDVAARASSPLP